MFMLIRTFQTMIAGDVYREQHSNPAPSRPSTPTPPDTSKHPHTHPPYQEMRQISREFSCDIFIVNLCTETDKYAFFMTLFSISFSLLWKIVFKNKFDIKKISLNWKGDKRFVENEKEITEAEFKEKTYCNINLIMI